jgi:quercetin dioxygenase-like cupin family protein
MMQVINWQDCEDVKIDKFPYRGKQYDVKGISVRWLSKHGDDGTGYPEYGLRFFTAQPDGEIPIHNHFYHQTMYIVSGQFECYQYDADTDEVVKSVTCGPGDLCCICNVYEEESV